VVAVVTAPGPSLPELAAWATEQLEAATRAHAWAVRIGSTPAAAEHARDARMLAGLVEALEGYGRMAGALAVDDDRKLRWKTGRS
jgi:hypothetical protein